MDVPEDAVFYKKTPSAPAEGG